MQSQPEMAWPGGACASLSNNVDGPKVTLRCPPASNGGSSIRPYAGKPVYPTLPPNGGDNVLGADNQQERLIMLGWVIGSADGEGCFSIGFVRQPSRRSRKGYRAG